MNPSKFTFKKVFYPTANQIELEGSLVSLHCHHFNCGLLKVFEELKGIDGISLLEKTAEEVFYQFFPSYLCRHPEINTPAQKLEAAAALYHFLGYGLLDLGALTPKGGKAKAYSSYYVTAWLAKYGRRSQKICYFTCGFLAGVLAVIFERPLFSYRVIEQKCLMLGDDYCEFLVKEASQCP